MHSVIVKVIYSRKYKWRRNYVNGSFHFTRKGSLADARLCTYILDDSDSIAIDKRPMMLICPGGGYEHTSDRESEPFAMHF